MAPVSSINLLPGLYGGGDPMAPFDWYTHSEKWLNDHRAVHLSFGVVYLFAVWGLERLMRNREPANIRWIVIMWNVALAVFSILGAIQTVPQLVESVRTVGFHASACDRTFYTTPTAYWVFWFNMSKVPEFLDTVLLRLRKRPVIFLHWYHHIVTMLYCWHANQYVAHTDGSGWYFASMNLTVHSVMYTYFAVTAYDRNVRVTLSKMGVDQIITTLQILQMFVGLCVLYTTSDCGLPVHGDPVGWWAALIMYFSYFVLFGKLYYDKYVTAQKKKAEKKAAAGAATTNGNGKAHRD